MSVMITSKLKANGQVTIPQPVLDALRLRQGDSISYSIAGDKVVLRNATTGVTATDDPLAVFAEWESDADRKAYAGL